MVLTEEAIEISNKTAMDLGYDTKKMKVKADTENSVWSSYLASYDVLKENKELASKLQHRDYWAVYFEPTEPMLGGDLFVFVNKKTGGILGVLRGQ